MNGLCGIQTSGVLKHKKKKTKKNKDVTEKLSLNVTNWKMTKTQPTKINRMMTNAMIAVRRSDE